MGRPRVEAGAWTFVGWAAATALLTPTIRLVAKANDFVVARPLLVDAVLIGYALLAGGYLVFRLRRGRVSRWLATLTVLPFLVEVAGPGGFGSFTVDLSGYPVVLVVLLWLANLALLALLASAILFLLSRPASNPAPAPHLA